MIDKALEFNPRNSKFLIEKGYCRLYQNDIDKAFLLFTQAGEIDINNKDSSIGTIYCKIINKKYKEAIEDIEFIKEIFISLNLPLSPKITYYQALIKFMDGEKEEVISSIISESLNTHVKLARQGNYNKYDILIATDYDFLYELAKSNLYV
jgi:tetratricopeptide (TPR) repeat protein